MSRWRDLVSLFCFSIMVEFFLKQDWTEVPWIPSPPGCLNPTFRVARVKVCTSLKYKGLPAGPGKDGGKGWAAPDSWIIEMPGLKLPKSYSSLTILGPVPEGEAQGRSDRLSS